MSGRKYTWTREDQALLFADGTPFCELSSEERRELLALTRPRVFKKSHFLFRSGEPVRGIFSILSGIVKVTQPHGQREIVVRLTSGGEWVGHRSIFTSDVYRGSAQTKTRTVAVFAPAEFLWDSFRRNKAFAVQLIRLIARDLESTERLLFEHQRLNIPSRLISLFRMLGKKIGQQKRGGQALLTKVTRVEIAEMIGASQEAVSRQLSKWKAESLLREENGLLFFSDELLNRIIRP